MKRFLADGLKFLAVQLLILAAIETAYQARVGKDHYLASFRDKERRLARVPPPRLLLVGGSSLAFGANSRVLERALGEPVVNLGLNAGLGLEFILRQAEDAAGTGDLLVVAPEYNLFSVHQVADSRVLLQLLSVAPDAVRFVAPREVPGLLDNALTLPSARIRALRRFLSVGRDNGIYTRASFDGRGDVVAHHRLATQRARGDGAGNAPSPEDRARACARLVVFAERVRGRGARVVMAPVPIPADDLAWKAAEIAELWTVLGRDAGIPVLDTDRAYPRDLFLDTAYHLTLDGKRKRTQSLLAALRRGPV